MDDIFITYCKLIDIIISNDYGKIFASLYMKCGFYCRDRINLRVGKK